MCTYCGTTNYYKIYENHYGLIGVDESGRALEVHHIDGNHNNNNPSNLTLVSINEHYKIHQFQGDHGACHAMAIRMGMSAEIISSLAKQAADTRIKNNNHHFLDKEWQINKARKQVADGTNSLLGGAISRKSNAERVANGTHNLLGDNSPSRRRSKDGTHHLIGGAYTANQLATGKHPSQLKMSCMCCRKIVSSANYHRWHGNNCRIIPTLA